MLVFGGLLFIVGVLARSYMNIKIAQAQSNDSTTHSTQIRYMRLVRNNGASRWPLIIAVVLMPLGIILTFGAIIWSNHSLPK
jgi:type III secretory pathway component EscT